MLHYVEKPQSYISPIINCGVYLFSLSIFELLAKVFNEKQRDFYSNGSLDNIEAKEAMWLEKDILMPMAGNIFKQKTRWKFINCKTETHENH